MRDLLDPAIVAQIDTLEVIARNLVEGFMRGLHESIARGSSLEFVEHRPYTPGDDIRRMDWRAYGKTDRYYLKQFEDETNLRSLLVIDASASMGFGSAGLSKFRYASTLAAVLGYLLLSQRDAVGLSLVDSELREFVPPRGTAEHLTGIFQTLERAPTGGPTALGPVLHKIAERMHTGSLALLFSDCLDDPQKILSGLSHLRGRHCEVMVFHIMDPAEEEFPFTGWVVLRDAEDPSLELRLDARDVRQAYAEQLDSHCDELRKGCRAAEIDYVLLKTDEPFETSLAHFLNIRSRQR
jgi:uncharacterized protein (DUF58 family)